MTDEHKLLRDADKAARAQSLLDNELLQESFANLESAYTAAWRVTDARDTDARERLWQAVNIIGKVRDHLTVIVSNGKLAAAELKTLAEAAERKKTREQVR